MRERGDCCCLHEPFMYYYYVHLAKRKFPGFDVEADRPTAFDDIVDMMRDESQKQIVFSKDMGYYVLPEIFQRPELAVEFIHVFLVRDPRKSILSYHKLDSAMQSDEIGLESLWRLHQWVDGLTAEGSGCGPVVVQAERVQENPQKVMCDLWDKIGIAQKPDAFLWDENHTPKDWRQVEQWHQNALANNSIQPEIANEEEIQLQFEEAAKREPKLRQYLEQHWPYFLKLRNLAI